MLVDFVLRTPEQSPDELISALLEAGINAVVFDREDTDLRAKIEESKLNHFSACVYRDEAAILFSVGLEDHTTDATDLKSWLENLDGVQGVVIANHPYDRTHGRPWGDRIYRLKGLTHVAVTSSTQSFSRDTLANAVVQKRNLGAISGSLGDSSAVGKLATFVDDSTYERAGFINALLDERTVHCRLESADEPYVELEEPRDRPGFRSDDDQRGGNRSHRRDGGRQRRGPRRR